MMDKMTLALVVVAACAGLIAADESPPMPERDPLCCEVVTAAGAKLDQTVSATAEFSGVVLVVRRGEIVLHKAYGLADKQTARPMTIATRVNVASISKAITSTAILKLSERNKLRRSDPIALYFPEAPTDKRAITIEQLLSHTSGYPQGYDGEGIAERTEAARAILSVALEQEPGAAFGYSNDNYGLLAMIVEIASGRPFDDFIRDEIFAPAGMLDSAPWGSVDITTDTSVAPPLEPLEAAVLVPNWGYRGSSGVLSTPRDLYRFFAALRAGRLLGPVSRDLLFAPSTPVRIGKAGYGWFATIEDTSGPALWTRGNESWGPSAVLTWYRERDVVIVVASNAGEVPGTDKIAYSRAMAATLERALFGD